jgi:hypothetical protein
VQWLGAGGSNLRLTHKRKEFKSEVLPDKAGRATTNETGTPDIDAQIYALGAIKPTIRRHQAAPLKVLVCLTVSHSKNLNIPSGTTARHSTRMRATPTCSLSHKCRGILTTMSEVLPDLLGESQAALISETCVATRNR